MATLSAPSFPTSSTPAISASPSLSVSSPSASPSPSPSSVRDTLHQMSLHCLMVPTLSTASSSSSSSCSSPSRAHPERTPTPQAPSYDPKGATQILDYLYLGGRNAAKDLEYLRTHNIQAVVNLCHIDGVENCFEDPSITTSSGNDGHRGDDDDNDCNSKSSSNNNIYIHSNNSIPRFQYLTFDVYDADNPEEHSSIAKTFEPGIEFIRAVHRMTRSSSPSSSSSEAITSSSSCSSSTSSPSSSFSSSCSSPSITPPSSSHELKTATTTTTTNNNNNHYNASSSNSNSPTPPPSVLVHCNCGVSRGPSLVLAYLIAEEKMTLKEALVYVRKRRAQVSPNNGFMRSLIEWEKKQLGSTSLDPKDFPPPIVL